MECAAVAQICKAFGKASRVSPNSNHRQPLPAAIELWWEFSFSVFLVLGPLARNEKRVRDETATGLPFLGLRALSDVMEGDANADFNAFTQSAADSLWPVVDHIITEF